MGEQVATARTLIFLRRLSCEVRPAGIL